MTNRYAAIPRTLAFIENGDDVLLLKGAPNKRLWADQYNGVGGHVEPGEGVREAALREVREETGLAIDELLLDAVIHVEEDGKPGVMLFVFSGESRHRDCIESGEGSLHWVPKREAVKLDLVEDLRQLLPKLLSKEDDCPIFGTYTYDDGELRVDFSD